MRHIWLTAAALLALPGLALSQEKSGYGGVPDDLRVTVTQRVPLARLPEDLQKGVGRSAAAAFDRLAATGGGDEGDTETTCNSQIIGTGWMVTCEICYADEGTCCACTVSSMPGPNNPCGCGSANE
jgi:hypothetical protein